MNKLNFTGQLIYFDYQQRDCNFDYQQPLNTDEYLPSSTDSKHYATYYRSTLSFRQDSDSDKSLNSTESSKTNSSLLSNHTNISLNLCENKINTNDEYFSFGYFNSLLSNSTQLYSRPLFDSLNLIIRILTSNIIDCKTYRLQKLQNKSIHCNFADVNVFSTRKSSSNQFKKQIELIGRSSTINNVYQSCQIDKHKDLSSIEKSLSPKIYYITSLFDEPFLMLRKRTNLQVEYNQSQTDLIQLRGQIFNFDQLEGFCVDLAAKVCSVLNITCQFRIVEDGGFGSKNASTGIWNGKQLLLNIH